MAKLWAFILVVALVLLLGFGGVAVQMNPIPVWPETPQSGPLWADAE